MRKSDRTCEWPSCDNKHSSKGLCSFHYQRRYQGVDMDVPKRRHRKKGEPPEPCVIEGCENSRAHADGVCAMHYQRRKNGRRPMDAPKLVRGGGWVDEHGYRKTRRDGKVVTEHRLVMEKMLGRPLHPWENVHHKNGVRHDNRPENLELWIKAQPAGARAEDLVAWVMDTYPELAAEHLRAGIRLAR